MAHITVSNYTNLNFRPTPDFGPTTILDLHQILSPRQKFIDLYQISINPHNRFNPRHPLTKLATHLRHPRNPRKKMNPSNFAESTNQDSTIPYLQENSISLS